ncbi:hypothetical protein [Jannaschia formosa]|uniref:hypothetical protein n=1 Tax=Jannaschia formosa TaxID=2259592 RepID=UPI000E1C28E9|nr:hypothetical protein [Jannaschia formosa]TFL18441.1 hypothetical protein DR046_10135 [Jannaschia formosa]
MTILTLLSDLLLLVATGGLAAWCLVLSRRLRAFDEADSGVGSSVAALSEEIAALKSAVAEVHAETDAKAAALAAQIEKADDRIGRLELLLAGLEDMEADLEDRLDAPPPAPEDVVPTFRASRAPSDRSLAR